ncbi:MAG: acyl-CoA thioesterase [Ilumatobacteraceae bacterium]
MVDRLALIEDGDGAFSSAAPTERHHVFGGLLVAQALRAAQTTVGETRPVHSLHASFVSAGTPEERVQYEVERTRDGASFGTRRVVARQAKGVVLVLTADFHDDEAGLEYELPAVRGLPSPDDLPPGRYRSRWFDSRDVPVEGVPAVLPHSRRSWFRPTVPIPDDPLLHLQVLAYLSDHGPTRAAREPHASLADDANRMSVSLDHSIWFHRPVDANQWLLSELLPVATGSGRGLSMGTIRRRDGALLATVAQEVLLRAR